MTHLLIQIRPVVFDNCHHIVNCGIHWCHASLLTAQLHECNRCSKDKMSKKGQPVLSLIEKNQLRSVDIKTCFFYSAINSVVRMTGMLVAKVALLQICAEHIIFILLQSRTT